MANEQERRTRLVTDRVRIKKGVRPYGGRVLKVANRETKPNGRRVVIAIAPNTQSGIWYGNDLRVYEEHEVEEVKPK